MISLFIFIIYDRYVLKKRLSKEVCRTVLYLNKIEIVNRLIHLNGKNSFSFFEMKKLFNRYF